MSNIVDFSPIAAKPPATPSKWDIIPIHSSDRATFKSCRRRWAWSSPSRLNLVPRSSVYGMSTSQRNLWFGTGIHHALERYYNPILREDPWIAWESWFNLQWYGGIVQENELKEFADRDPQVHDHNGNNEFTYKVAGLSDTLPDFGEDYEGIFLNLKEVGTGMMKYYKEYAEANDNFTVIMVEHDFSVPVLNEKWEPMYAVDTRLMPEDWEPDFTKENEFGPLMREIRKGVWQTEDGVAYYAIEKQVHVRGRMDQIQQDNEFGRYGIMDYKTAATIGEDYFNHLELDEQSTSYLTFGELEARIYGLEYQNLEYITFMALRKNYPQPPSVTSKGLPSLDRQKESTTAKLFEQFILENGLKPLFDADEKMQRYYTYLLDMGDDLYIQRKDTWRNTAQRRNAMIRLYYEARDMLDPSLVCYPNPQKDFTCVHCAFRLPCIQAESGDDYMDTLENGYISNWNR